MTALEQAKHHLAAIADLCGALAVLDWDQATHLPERAFAARGHQLATLTETLHQKRTDAELGRLLDRCAHELASADPLSIEASWVRVARRDFEKAQCVPSEFASRLAAHQSASYAAWTLARPANDFARLIPLMERTLDFSRELSSFHAGFSHIADPLIDRADAGMTVERLRPLFSELRGILVPMLRQISECPKPDLDAVRGNFDADAQIAFGRQIIERMGYDFARGRQDRTHHPFMTPWNERYQADLGVAPETDTDGVMQDVHWYADLIGGQFQCYALGNVLSAQLFEAANRALPEIAAETSNGRFGTLREWLRDKVHCHGRSLEVDALIEHASGAPLRIDAYRDYLHAKFGGLYSIDRWDGPAA